MHGTHSCRYSTVKLITIPKMQLEYFWSWTNIWCRVLFTHSRTCQKQQKLEKKKINKIRFGIKEPKRNRKNETKYTKIEHKVHTERYKPKQRRKEKPSQSVCTEAWKCAFFFPRTLNMLKMAIYCFLLCWIRQFSSALCSS